MRALHDVCKPGSSSMSHSMINKNTCPGFVPELPTRPNSAGRFDGMVARGGFASLASEQEVDQVRCYVYLDRVKAFSPL